jgi:DNA-binding NarL/FixJ family response regulator
MRSDDRDGSRRPLLVLDEEGTLSSVFINRLDGIGPVQVMHSGPETHHRLDAGECRAVLIAVGGGSFASMSLAFYARELHPDIPVVVLGDGFDPQLSREAVRVGLDLVVKGGDLEALVETVAARLNPAVVSP